MTPRLVSATLMALAAVLILAGARRRAAAGQHRAAMLLLVAGSIGAVAATVTLALSLNRS